MHSLGALFKSGLLQNIKNENTMKTIYIHIGMHRTGTSTFQKFLELNAEKLNAEKIGVFMAGQHRNANSSEYFMMESRSRSQEYLELKSFLRQDYDSFIISAEELSRFDYESIASLKSILDSYSNTTIKIISCIRQPNEYIDSAGAKLIEDFGYTLQTLASCEGLIPMYSSLVDWKEIYGKELKLFHFSDDTLTSILEIIGLGDKGYARPPKENASKCLEYIAIKASLNDPRYVQAKQLLGVVCKGMGIRKFILPQEVAMSVGADVNKEVRSLNLAFGDMLDEINIHSRPKMSQYSNQQFLASCLRYFLDSIIATVPVILANGGLAYSNYKEVFEEGFDPFGYLINNFDLCTNFVNPREHYDTHGKSEGRTFFDSKIIDQINLLNSEK